MSSSRRSNTAVACLAAAAFLQTVGGGSPPPNGGVVEFFQDREGWMSAGGEFTTVDFTGLEKFTVLSDQYEDLGVLFTDGNDEIAEGGFYLDRFGAYGGAFGEEGITTVFSQPRFWIAVDYPGRIKFQLFRDGDLVYDSESYHSGGEIAFFGLVSDEPFDEAIIFDPLPGTYIDNLFFGPPCSADLDGTGDVAMSDILQLLVTWGECPVKGRCAEDLDGSGAVDFGDILIVLSAWGECP